MKKASTVQELSAGTERPPQTLLRQKMPSGPKIPPQSMKESSVLKTTTTTNLFEKKMLELRKPWQGLPPQKQSPRKVFFEVKFQKGAQRP